MNIDRPVLQLHFDLNLHWVGYTVARLDAGGKLGRSQEHGTPVIAPRSEAALFEVGLVAVLSGHVVQSLRIDEAQRVFAVVDGTAGTVDDNLHFADGQICAQVPDAVGAVGMVRVQAVLASELWHGDEEVAGYLCQVDDVKLYLVDGAGGVTFKRCGTSRNILAGGHDGESAHSGLVPIARGTRGHRSQERLRLPDVKAVRLSQCPGVAEPVVLELDVWFCIGASMTQTAAVEPRRPIASLTIAPDPRRRMKHLAKSSIRKSRDPLERWGIARGHLA